MRLGAACVIHDLDVTKDIVFDQPLHAFRTDSWDWAGEMDHTDPDIRQKSGAANKAGKAQARQAFENRKKFEAAKR